MPRRRMNDTEKEVLRILRRGPQTRAELKEKLGDLSGKMNSTRMVRYGEIITPVPGIYVHAEKGGQMAFRRLGTSDQIRITLYRYGPMTIDQLEERLKSPHVYRTLYVLKKHGDLTKKRDKSWHLTKDGREKAKSLDPYVR